MKSERERPKTLTPTEQAALVRLGALLDAGMDPVSALLALAAYGAPPRGETPKESIEATITRSST